MFTQIPRDADGYFEWAHRLPQWWHHCHQRQDRWEVWGTFHLLICMSVHVFPVLYYIIPFQWCTCLRPQRGSPLGMANLSNIRWDNPVYHPCVKRCFGLRQVGDLQLEVMEISLDKCGSATERRLAIIDKNRDLYLTQVRVYGKDRKTVKLC